MCVGRRSSFLAWPLTAGQSWLKSLCRITHRLRMYSTLKSQVRSYVWVNVTLFLKIRYTIDANKFRKDVTKFVSHISPSYNCLLNKITKRRPSVPLEKTDCCLLCFFCWDTVFYHFCVRSLLQISLKSVYECDRLLVRINSCYILIFSSKRLPQPVNQFLL